MKFVVDLSVYKSAEKIGVNSLKCLLAIQERKDINIILSSDQQSTLWKICMDDSNQDLRTWFVNMRSTKRLSRHDVNAGDLRDTLQPLFDSAHWSIVTNDLDNVVLALQHGDKIIVFCQSLSQGCTVLSQHPHPNLKTIDWRDSSLPDTAHWIDTVAS